MKVFDIMHPSLAMFDDSIVTVINNNNDYNHLLSLLLHCFANRGLVLQVLLVLCNSGASPPQSSQTVRAPLCCPHRGPISFIHLQLAVPAALFSFMIERESACITFPHA